MDAIVRKHLSVIIAVTVIGLITGAIAMYAVYNNVASLSVSMFSTLVFVIPCVILFLMSFAIAATASEIGRSLYIAVLVICIALGLVSMFVASGWMSDEQVSALLLANSPEGTTILPILRAPIVMLRDIAAFVVVPTVGCILGAWVGSRLHPMRGEKNKKRKKKR